MSNVATTVFIMPSGVECEVREFTGKDQRLLTEQDGKNFSEKLNNVLLSIVVRIGSKLVVTQEDIKNLLAEDRKCILWNARMFSVGDPIFKFEYKYIDTNKKEQVFKMDVDLSETDTIKPYKQQWTELSEIDKKVRITLPRSGKKVEYTLLDGVGEATGSAVKKSELSSHTPLLMRNPLEMLSTNDGKTVTPIKVNLDSLSLVDIEFLRQSIADNEGKFHTEMQFEHPEAEKKMPSERMVVVNLLGEMAFFFPSGRI